MQIESVLSLQTQLWTLQPCQMSIAMQHKHNNTNIQQILFSREAILYQSVFSGFKHNSANWTNQQHSAQHFSKHVYKLAPSQISKRCQLNLNCIRCEVLTLYCSTEPTFQSLSKHGHSFSTPDKNLLPEKVAT